MNIEEEKKLVILAKGGDKQAVSLLWDEFTPVLYGYLLNTLKNKQVAEDVLQSTWLKALQGLPKYRFMGYSVKSWLFRIARNELSEYFRKNPGLVDLEELGEYSVNDETTTRIENEIDVGKVLLSLNAEDRELIRLRFIADLSVIQIAKVLNISSILVRVRLHRVTGRLKSKYKFYEK